jgi:hypothetical protein
MQAGCEKVLSARESALRGQADKIQSGDVAGLIAADADVCFGGGDEGCYRVLACSSDSPSLTPQ